MRPHPLILVWSNHQRSEAAKQHLIDHSILNALYQGIRIAIDANADDGFMLREHSKYC